MQANVFRAAFFGIAAGWLDSGPIQKDPELAPVRCWRVFSWRLKVLQDATTCFRIHSDIVFSSVTAEGGGQKMKYADTLTGRDVRDRRKIAGTPTLAPGAIGAGLQLIHRYTDPGDFGSDRRKIAHSRVGGRETALSAYRHTRPGVCGKVSLVAGLVCGVATYQRVV